MLVPARRLYNKLFRAGRYALPVVQICLRDELGKAVTARYIYTRTGYELVIDHSNALEGRIHVDCLPEPKG